MATDDYELLFVNPDDKYGNCYRYDNYTYKCIVKEVRRDQLNHKWFSARYRNSIVRELYRRVGGQSRLFINPTFAQLEPVLFCCFSAAEDRPSDAFDLYD